MGRRVVFVLVLVLLGSSLVVQAGATPGSPSVAGLDYALDVETQFSLLTERADAMGFHMADAPFDPSLCRHWQGVARSQGEGTPYMFVARSGNQPPVPCIQWCEDWNVPCTEVGQGFGHLVVVEMGSRDQDGERLRSNRLARGVDQADTVPDQRDRVVTTITFKGDDGWPSYGHPGGLQVVGDVLVVPLETPYEGSEEINEILFVDISDPTDPSPIRTLEVPVTEDFTAGLAGIAPRPDGTWLLVVAGQKNLEVRYYASSGVDLHDPDLEWTLAHTYWPDDDPLQGVCGVPDPEAPRGSYGWPEGSTFDVAYQSLNLLREGGPDGTLYMVGGRATSQVPGFGSDWFDLYEVVENGDGTIGLACVDKHHVQTWPSLDPSFFFKHNLAHFAAATGAHVTPSGQLVLYGTEHDNDGPAGTVKFGEWRNIEMALDGSPSYDPSVGPTATSWTVPEGSTVDLSAIASAPTTKAWVELFADPDWTDDRYVVIDYDDWALDDHDDFRKLDEGPFGDGFSNQATSGRWFAPVGCDIVLRDHALSNPEPGDDTATIVGTGEPGQENHFDDLPQDNGEDGMDDDVTAVVFTSGCDAYYDASRYAIAWDLDEDGTHETAGGTATLSAAGLDGPSTVRPSIRVEHPDDGRTGLSRATVDVVNVAPAVTSLALLDPAGRDVLGAGLPLLAGTPLRLEATFDDAGQPDTHTVEIDWGDGTTTTTAGLDSFVAATGPGEGALAATGDAGSPGTRTITLTIVDDDGGVTVLGVDVAVLTLEDAVQYVVDELTALLPTSDQDVAEVVESAIAALVGERGDGSADGALDHLEAGSLVAAMIALGEAVELLESLDPSVVADADIHAGTLALVGHALTADRLELAAAGDVVPPQQLAAATARHGAAAAHLALGEWSATVADDTSALRRLLAAAGTSEP